MMPYTTTAAPGPAAATPDAATALSPLGLEQVRITGGFWSERQVANRDVSIPDGYRQIHEAHNVRNFEIAAGTATGEPEGPIFADSDVYKWLEAAAWEYGREPDEELLAQQLELTAIVAAAQEEDGYLDTMVRLTRPERYTNPAHDHEHYCAGHLFQAAVAQSRATGHDELLEVAVKLADHLVRTFGPGKREDVDGHPVVEMGLVELYRQTGNRDYLDLAQYFVDARGHGLTGRYPDANLTYLSDRVPVREQTTVEGHAVRAVYFAAGAADVATETGDAELLTALGRQYAHMMRTKQYVTGGLGSRWDGEAFGDPYELPSDRAYAETCAAIGGVQWAWRMLLATGDTRYGDQIERMLYNGFLPGVSLGGGEYFYVNTLHVRDGAHADQERNPAGGRLRWFGCACCPPNVMRTLSSLAAYAVTATADGVQLHQYGDLDVAAADLRLRVETDYPWDGTVRVAVVEAPDGERTIALRVPGWAEGATLDGRPVGPGLAGVTRTFAAGDVLELRLPMPVRRVTAHPRVDDVRGQVALERGPLVYAFEGADQADDAVLDDLAVDGGEVTTSAAPEHLPGVVALAVPAALRDPESRATRPVTAVAVPYFAWANRGPGPMRIWLPAAER
jgi:DUF1680 family protein